MDIEQLQMLLDAARAAGEGAVGLVWLWFGLLYLKVVLYYGAWAVFIVVVVKFLYYLVKATMWSGQVDAAVNFDDYTTVQKRQKLIKYLGEYNVKR